MRTGNRSLTEPITITDLRDDLAVEISLAMKRQGLRLCDLRRRFDWSNGRTVSLSRYLRGLHSDFGHISALRVAESLDIPVRILVGDEARAA